MYIRIYIRIRRYICNIMYTYMIRQKNLDIHTNIYKNKKRVRSSGVGGIAAGTPQGNTESRVRMKSDTWTSETAASCPQVLLRAARCSAPLRSLLGGRSGRERQSSPHWPDPVFFFTFVLLRFR